MQIAIQPYEENFKEQLVFVWERSVWATHHFLKHSDITYYKNLVKDTDFASFPVYCLTSGNKVLGFIGVENFKIEMLFLDPQYIGQGLGKMLMNFALHSFNAVKVDVNEQNLRAVRFYTQFGFTTYGRTEKDSVGKDYPILEMQLTNRP